MSVRFAELRLKSRFGAVVNDFGRAGAGCRVGTIGDGEVGDMGGTGLRARSLTGCSEVDGAWADGLPVTVDALLVTADALLVRADAALV